MRRWLAGLMILLLVATAGAETLPPGDKSATIGDLAQTMALFEQVDSRTLPAGQRQALYFAVADALLKNGQPERALNYLGQLRDNVPPPVSPYVDDQLRALLQKINGQVLTASLQVDTPLAALLHSELAQRTNAPPPAAPDVRTIGVLLPLSGRFAAYGLSVQQGVELARSVGTMPQPVRFDFRDTAGDAVGIAPLMQELAAAPGVEAIIGLLSGGDADAAAAVAEHQEMPLILLAPRERTTGGYVFQNALTAGTQVRVLADHAVKGHGLQRFVILHPDNRYGELFAGLFQAAVERHGGLVLACRSYPAGAVDLRETLQALAADVRRGGSGPPEALFLPDDAQQVAQIIPQLGFSRLDQLQLLGTSAWSNPELVRLAGPQIEGAIFVDGFFADSPNSEVRDFVTRFQEVYGAPPGLLAAQGYDTARLLLTLLARSSQGDHKVLRQALNDLRGFSGVTGETRFGPQGEAEKSLFLLQVQAGAVVQIN